MNRKTVMVGMISLVAVAACGGAEESSESGAAHGGEEADNTPQSFPVRLDRATTAESVIPQIVAAGQRQLAKLCEEHPRASVRVMNPLASRAYTDVPCSSMLADDGATGQASAALVISESDGPIGQTQQRIGPISLLACGVAGIGTSLFARYALCPHGKTERERRNCEDVGLWGTIGIGVICMIPF